MTSIFGLVLLLLYTRVLYRAQRSTEKEKEYGNDKSHNKAVLFCRLLFDACSKQPQVINWFPPQVFIRFSNLNIIKGNYTKYFKL